MPEPDLESNAHMGKTLLVWDAEGPPPVGDWTTALWSSFGDPGVISIPTLVEEQADALRGRYLAWIYELGEARISGKRLVDHLELRPGFSYWWMTSLAQKFNSSGTSQIDNAIKLLVLESLVSEHKPTSILVVSGNNNIVSVLKIFSKKLGLSFKWKPVTLTGKQKPSIARQIYRTLPPSFRALIYFNWYLFRSLAFLRTKNESVQVVNGDIAFVDALVHLDGKALTTGTFVSNYWTVLVDKLLHSKVKTNWLHNYFFQEEIPKLVRAHELTQLFTKSSKGLQTHILLESNISLTVLLKALKDYFRIRSSGLKISQSSQYFNPSGSSIDFWPLFKQEWIDSVRGQSAMGNCLRVCLYEKTFSALPYQKLGVYIQENQPWEMALIHAWKSAGHGRLIGAPHTTVRYWDLRYFYDFRSYVRKGNNDLPIPDLVAVNGPVARNYYLKGGYPEHRVTEVEALRFFHLLNRSPALSRKAQQKVLVCGDFLSETTYKLLSWLLMAARFLPPETTYIFKPHPAYPVNLSAFDSLKLKETNAPLAELFADCDIVFTSNITSAAVDAYCSGIPVVQMLDGSTFNLSPLRDREGVLYVTKPAELSDALRNAKQRDWMMPEPYFWLDKELPRWQKLLGMTSEDARDTAGS